jgi:hypothetical protein
MATTKRLAAQKNLIEKFGQMNLSPKKEGGSCCMCCFGIILRARSLAGANSKGESPETTKHATLLPPPLLLLTARKQIGRQTGKTNAKR